MGYLTGGSYECRRIERRNETRRIMMKGHANVCDGMDGKAMWGCVSDLSRTVVASSSGKTRCSY